jgi:uncharacterized protein YkwD
MVRRLFVLAVAAIFAGTLVDATGAATMVPSGGKRGAPTAAVRADGVTRMPALEEEMLAAINEYRQAHGLSALRLNAELAATARQHSLSMAEKGYFDHASLTGSPFWKRIEGKYSKRATRWFVGENLVWGSPDLTAGEALTMWLESPAHRKNLLMAAWREIGLGAVHSLSAPGVYGGLAATILTADFGVRRG